MNKTNFTKNLILHIRYPWTALVILILWLGTAALCIIENYSSDNIIILTSASSIATLILAIVGFKG